MQQKVPKEGKYLQNAQTYAEINKPPSCFVLKNVVIIKTVKEKLQELDRFNSTFPQLEIMSCSLNSSF